MVPTVPLTRPGGDAPKQVNESRLNPEALDPERITTTRCNLDDQLRMGLSAMVPVRMRVSALAGGAAANDSARPLPRAGQVNSFIWTPSMIRCDVHRSTRHDHLHRSTARHTRRSGRIPLGSRQVAVRRMGYPSKRATIVSPLAWTGPRKRNDPLAAVTQLLGVIAQPQDIQRLLASSRPLRVRRQRWWPDGWRRGSRESPVGWTRLGLRRPTYPSRLSLFPSGY